MNYLKLFTTYLIAVFLFTGCAIHAPMSEMLMFQEKKVDGQVYNSKAGYGGISIAGDLTSNKFDNYYCGSNDNDCNAGNEPSINVHNIILTDSTNNYAVSVALGLPVGIDATVNVIDNLYVTGAIAKEAVDLHGQLVLQHKILDGNPIGLSVGAKVSRENWVIKSSQARLSIDHEKATNVGFRTVVMLTPILDYGQSRPFLYLTGGYNYDFKSDLTYPKIGIAIGLY